MTKSSLNPVQRQTVEIIESLGFGSIERLWIHDGSPCYEPEPRIVQAIKLDSELERQPTFAEYALGHVSRLLGANLVVEITPNLVKRYQADRLNEKAGPKTINDEVQLLIRLCGEQGVLVRATLRRDKALKLEAKRRALDEIAARQRTADEKRKQEIERQRQAEAVSQTLVVQ
jgi:hypothetical protein